MSSRGAKRKTEATAEGRRKRAKVTKPTEFFPEKRNLVVSPFPPSDKIGIKSIQRETEEIVPMKQMKMDWVPYIPLDKRESQVERLKSPLFILSCTQRRHYVYSRTQFEAIITLKATPRVGIKHTTLSFCFRAGLQQMNLERIKKFEYCLPYIYNPFLEDEIEQSTELSILYPIDPKPVICEFDWDLDEVEEFTDKLIEEEGLSEDQKEPFKNFLKEKVREAKKANREAREARKKAAEEMSAETKAAFDNMKVYKFYPVSTPDTPNVSEVKATYINRYYGKAYMVL